MLTQYQMLKQALSINTTHLCHMPQDQGQGRHAGCASHSWGPPAGPVQGVSKFSTHVQCSALMQRTATQR